MTERKIERLLQEADEATVWREYMKKERTLPSRYWEIGCEEQAEPIPDGEENYGGEKPPFGWPEEETEETTNRPEIISGDFVEGEMVTVRINGKEFTRRVKYSARKWADLYITINGHEITYTEFCNHDAFADADYSFIH